MKKIMKVLTILFALTLMFTWSCAGGPKRIDDLDAAIRETSDYLNSNIPRGSKIVILNIQSDSPALSDYVIDELIANAVNDKVFQVVDRQQLDAIRAEQNFQFSGEVADDQALAIGRFFGAQTIVSGAVSKLGAGHRIRVRALEVQTALVQGQYNRNISASPLIETITASHSPATASAQASNTRQQTSGANTAQRTLTIINNTGNALDSMAFNIVGRPQSEIQMFQFTNNIGNNETRAVNLNNINTSADYIIAVTDVRRNIYGKAVKFNTNVTVTFSNADLTQAGPGQPSPSQSTPSSNTRYRVGDAGPAGGIIFHDKGNNNQGWRYLEAAPVEAEFQAVWSVRGTRVDDLQEIIGSGRRNTQLIVEAFAATSGEWDTAAQKCAELTFGGFNDWFLPSNGELDQMYGQLKRRNLGDFKNEQYWNSSRMAQNFSNGQINRDAQFHVTTRRYVRPIRQVAGPAN